MADCDLVVDCSTGQVEQVPLTPEQVAQIQATQEAYAQELAVQAAAEQARQQKIGEARQILANNPDLKTVLEALGLVLPEGP